MRIDWDGQRVPIGEWMERLHRANRELRAVGEWVSPSGKGWHLWVWVEPAPRSACETVALQLLLGSDPYREAYNLNRARAVDAGLIARFWAERWNVLYGKE